MGDVSKLEGRKSNIEVNAVFSWEESVILVSVHNVSVIPSPCALPWANHFFTSASSTWNEDVSVLEFVHKQAEKINYLKSVLYFESEMCIAKVKWYYYGNQ